MECFFFSEVFKYDFMLPNVDTMGNENKFQISNLSGKRWLNKRRFYKLGVISPDSTSRPFMAF